MSKKIVKSAARQVSAPRVTKIDETSFAALAVSLGVIKDTSHGVQVRTPFRNAFEKISGGRKFGSHATITDLHRAVLRDMCARREIAPQFVAQVTRQIPAGVEYTSANWDGATYAPKATKVRRIARKA